MQGAALGAVSDADKGDRENALIIADYRQAGAEGYGDLFVAHKLFHAFVHTAHKYFILRGS